MSVRFVFFSAFLALLSPFAVADMLELDFVSFAGLAVEWHKLPSSEDVADRIALAEIDRDAFVARDFQVTPGLSVKEYARKADAEWLAVDISSNVRHLTDWSNPVSRVAVQKISEHRELLRRFIGKSSVWPWLLQQLGEKAAAKKLLEKLYGTETVRVMKLRGLNYESDWHSNLLEAEYL